jgi:hypothetical protein
VQRLSADRIQLQLGSPADFGTSRVPSNPNAMQVLYILLMTPGVFVTLHALSVYPPVNARFPMAVMLFMFLLPVVLMVLSFVLNRPNENQKTWRILYVSSSVALLLLAILLFLNGYLDRSSPNEVRTTVIRKAVIRGRSTQYNLSVSSWTPDRSIENFNVAMNVFERAAVGKTVTVELHKGFFGMPWHGKIWPE